MKTVRQRSRFEDEFRVDLRRYQEKGLMQKTRDLVTKIAFLFKCS